MTSELARAPDPVAPQSSPLLALIAAWLKALFEVPQRLNFPTSSTTIQEIMSGILSYVPGVNRLVGSGSAKTIDLPSAKIHHIETNPERPARRLKHLLKANHANYALLYHNLQFDNHNAHALSSAYLLGANEDQLRAIFDEEAQSLEPWKPSPAEIIDEDWEDFLGNKEYQRAFLDYYEDKLAMVFSYDWKEEVKHFLFKDKNPLFHGLVDGRKGSVSPARPSC